LITTRKIGRRGYKAEAKRRWGAKNILWIQGEGPWALAALCPRGISITLWQTHAEAVDEKKVLDNINCGGKCWGPAYHIVRCLLPEA
jgi:hypothetical protein